MRLYLGSKGGRPVTLLVMTQLEQQVTTAQWMLERQLHFITQAEVKVAAVVTIDIAMLAGLFAAWESVDTHTDWVKLFSIACVAILAFAVFFSAMCLMPRIEGSKYTSILYFGDVAKMDSQAYVAAHKQMSQEQILQDWMHQVHRNAQIAKAKHDWVRKALIGSFLGGACWLAAIVILAV